MRRLVFVVATLMLMASVGSAELTWVTLDDSGENYTAASEPIVVDFDDVPAGTILTGSDYGGLTWEQGNAGYQGKQGYWMIPEEPRPNNYPYSPPHNVINGWGCTRIGIGFGAEVDVLGAYFAGQGAGDSYTIGVRVHGYNGAAQISETPWFYDIDEHPDWFAMNLTGVDRIVIESIPVNEGGGWYGMDNLTYIPEPTTLSLLGFGGLPLMRKRCKK